ncbi:MAG: Unknown protein [uncultured Thiotrichaceae bacterium]|uniref:Uncharacterized protein n=1 Tax=uncultured Thiotrichaceae bacterium TaxID=298394 RepID=A0A6S6TYB3_9GAMM|nr:MAG: Unknown protein [uncultured Thiotrichaceae bacterium]
MQKKLTLRLENKLIESEIAPVTKSLIGIIKSNQVDESDYKKHLEEKYL